jgi:hypothetical protein
MNGKKSYKFKVLPISIVKNLTFDEIWHEHVFISFGSQDHTSQFYKINLLSTTQILRLDKGQSLKIIWTTYYQPFLLDNLGHTPNVVIDMRGCIKNILYLIK